MPGTYRICFCLWRFTEADKGDRKTEYKGAFQDGWLYTIREGVCMKQLREDIRVLTHAAIRLVLKDEHHEDVVIYCDPFHLVETTADADLILVTHAHYDH